MRASLFCIFILQIWRANGMSSCEMYIRCSKIIVGRSMVWSSRWMSYSFDSHDPRRPNPLTCNHDFNFQHLCFGALFKNNSKHKAIATRKSGLCLGIEPGKSGANAAGLPPRPLPTDLDMRWQSRCRKPRSITGKRSAVERKAASACTKVWVTLSSSGQVHEPMKAVTNPQPNVPTTGFEAKNGRAGCLATGKTEK